MTTKTNHAGKPDLPPIEYNGGPLNRPLMPFEVEFVKRAALAAPDLDVDALDVHVLTLGDAEFQVLFAPSTSGAS